MATLIDSLVMEIKLDPALYKQGEQAVEAANKRLRDDANTTGKELEASGKNAAQFFSQVKTEALGLIGVLVGAGGIKAFLGDTTRSLADLGRASVNIGISAQNLAAFQNVVRRNGGSAEAATASLKGLVDQIERFKVFGDPAVFKFLNPIGANINDSPLAIWQRFVEFADKHRNDPALVNLIGHGLGFDQDLINTSLQIKGAADAVKQLAEEMHRVPTPGMIDNATKLQTAWVDLSDSAKYAAEVIQDKLSPAEKAVLEWTTQLIDKQPALAAGLAVIAGYLITIAGLKFPRLLAMLGSIPGMVTVGAAAVLAETYLTNKEKQGEFKDAAGKLGFQPTETDALHPIPDFVNPSTNERLTWEEMGKRLGPPYSNNVGGGGWLERMFSGGGSPGGGPPAQGTPAAGVALRTHDFWRAQGFTEEQTAGILAAGPGAESGFNPASIGDNGTSFGLYQHHADRWAAMQARFGTKYPIEQQQNEYAAWEISPQGPLANVGASMRRAQTGEETARIFTQGFEHPANTAAEADRRAGNASKYLEIYENKSRVPPTPKLYEPPPIPAAPGAPPASPLPPTPAVPGQPGPQGAPGATPPDRTAPPAQPQTVTVYPQPQASPLIRLDPALVPQPGASVSNYHHQNDNSVSVSIGAIHTQATDAKGIAADMRDAATDAFVQQANRGLT